MTKKGKIVIALILGVLVVFVAYRFNLIPGLKFTPSAVPESTTGMERDLVRGQSAAPKPFVSPSTTPVKGAQQAPTIEIIPWNSQRGLILGNGGPYTTEGSLVAQYGGNFHIIRQNNCITMKGNALHSAQVSSRGGKPDIVGWTIMGGYSATWAGPLNKELAQYGDRVVLAASFGRSLGEDKWLDENKLILNDPQKARGSVVVGCVGDDDINICLNFAEMNKIPVNPDLGTFDPDAINFVHVDDFTNAHKMWIAGAEVPLKDKKTGKVKNYKITGIATWTPGDEAAVTGRPGLVTVASTKDFPNQMPNAFYVLESWAKKHPDQVAALIAAAFEAADQINAFPAADQKSGELSALVYGERNGQYWTEIAHGYPVTDRLGNTVVVGGSMVHNLSDNQVLFGLNGGRNIFESATYMHHAEFIHKLWPEMLTEIAPFSSIFDPTYLQLAARKVPARQAIYREDFATRQTTTPMSKADYSDISFELGSDQLTYQARQVLTGVCEQLSTASGVKIQLAGHTDSQGDDASNMDLSRRRVYTVKTFMENYDPNTFGAGRIEVQWFGESQLKVYGESQAAHAANRRVVITTFRMQ